MRLPNPLPLPLLEARVTRGGAFVWALLLLVGASAVLRHTSDPAYTGLIFTERIVALALAPLFAAATTEDVRNRMGDLVASAPRSWRTRVRRLVVVTSLALVGVLGVALMWQGRVEPSLATLVLTAAAPTLALGYATYALASLTSSEGEALTAVFIAWAVIQTPAVMKLFAQAPLSFAYLFPASGGIAVSLVANKLVVLSAALLTAAVGVLTERRR